MNLPLALQQAHQPIVAIATAPGRGAVGIVRVSSAAPLDGLVQALCGRQLQPRRAHFGAFVDAAGVPIDQGLALLFPAPHSYTGEHVLELQAHGGPVVLQLLLARCLQAAAEVDPEAGGTRLPGLRLAEPGEFTQRAFLNDKLDLAQAEAVADLIEASTEAAARSAGRSLGGAFSREVELLRERTVRLRMLVEATLDFPEEEIDFLERADARGQLQGLLDTVAAVQDRAHQGALLREGLRVVLAGQPNVGKSSLLNALAGAELAIVTPIPGTTRDKVSETLQIEGVPLHITDTAGLRDTDDEVERIGVARSWSAIGEADAVLFLHDLTRQGQPDYDAAEALIATRLVGADPSRVLHVATKLDLVDRTPGVVGAPGPDAASTAAGTTAGTAAVAAEARLPAGQPTALRVSARTGEGLPGLRRALLQRAGWHASPEGVFIARKRHVQALARTREHLLLAQAHAEAADTALDLLAEELRLAHEALGEITGRFTPDDLLGEIFSRFCIGK